MPTAKAVGISACRKSLVFDVLLLYHSALTMIMATDSSVCRTALLGFAIRMGTLVNMKEGDNQRDQDKGLDSPSPCPLGFLPLAPSFLTHTHTPSGCWTNSNNHPNIVCPVNAGTLNATRPQVSTYISG